MWSKMKLTVHRLRRKAGSDQAVGGIAESGWGTWILGDGVADEEHSNARFDSSMCPGQWESIVAAKLRNPALPEPSKVTWDMPEALSQSRTPTLLIAGLQDRMLEKGWEDKLGQHLREVTIERLDSGHAPNISDPKTTAQVLRRFFERIDQSPTSSKG